MGMEKTTKTIRMTAEQTEIYDNGGDDVRDPMMRKLRAEARALMVPHPEPCGNCGSTGFAEYPMSGQFRRGCCAENGAHELHAPKTVEILTADGVVADAVQ